MKYKEAIRLKAGKAPSFEEGGVTYKVFVTPGNADDLKRYLRDIRGFYSLLTDRDAKRYSKNGRFLLCGLCYNKKGPSILLKQLENTL